MQGKSKNAFLPLPGSIFLNSVYLPCLWGSILGFALGYTLVLVLSITVIFGLGKLHDRYFHGILKESLIEAATNT